MSCEMHERSRATEALGLADDAHDEQRSSGSETKLHGTNWKGLSFEPAHKKVRANGVRRKDAHEFLEAFARGLVAALAEDHHEIAHHAEQDAARVRRLQILFVEWQTGRIEITLDIPCAKDRPAIECIDEERFAAKTIIPNEKMSGSTRAAKGKAQTHIGDE